VLVRDWRNVRGLDHRSVRVAVRRPWENEKLVGALKELGDR
jgi:histidinol-phosphate/aromatic aminotransferase/cobyric acid decarboxylase-like protein